MAATIYLITGANKGIGRGIVEQLLQRPDTTVIAGVRRPSDPTCVSLLDTPVHESGTTRLFVCQLLEDADFDQLYFTLPDGNKLVPGNHNPKSAGEPVHHLDVVIANAGDSQSLDRNVLQTTPEDVIYDCTVNAAGPLRLFRSTWPLMEDRAKKAAESAAAGACTKFPKFILMSSTMGSIGVLDLENMGVGIAYGMSKAAANWFGKHVSVQYKDKGLVVGILHPGWVQTDMGQALADVVGMKEPPVTVKESASGCLEQIDNLAMEKTGAYITYKGQPLPW